MFTLALRGMAAVAATAAALFVWLGSPPNSTAGTVPFSKVMDELRTAQTLFLKVQKQGTSADVWVRAPGLVRREESPRHYQIAAGSRLWKINEAENTVTTSDSPWFINPREQVDLLGLLDVGVQDSGPLLRARPVERKVVHGRDCFVYQVDLPGKSGDLEVVAVAEAKSLQLVEIMAWPRVAKNNIGPPLAELRLVAMNLPVADDKFEVDQSLTEDGRIGKVGASQGIVGLRPMLSKRWTPVCHEMLLRPGDWLRTELRGANAVRLAMSSQVELTLGPGTLIECISPTQARVHEGVVQVQYPVPAKADIKGGFTLLAPRDGKREFKPGDKKQLVRVDRQEKLVDVAQTPVWLAGFEGTTSNESLGSLIVNLPDGRNEPLTVGYHKVSVEIRDQIARTTIEESFVNHTPNRLEGVFHFPLPQDASISGFGMWIGNDLVEADVVEKQRAREIYETILRERRDPGLLEWTSGNIFKARVFPIEGRSEKRIKIVYTQVLPLRANRYRYSYGLRSEMLRTKPLRELSLTVTVNSALPLKSISCPTHPVRSQQTAHSGQVEFFSQDYIPTRDFEVVCEVDGQQSDVVVIPHRRGADGYFLVQLTPPGPAGNWQRELLPDGKPLSVVLLCDTSASMDTEKRRQQSEFVGSVLSSLSAEDKFLLGAADVGTVWATPEPVAVNAENVAQARAFLDDRVSLGWTDLDRAFTETNKKAPAGSQVIYIGDGIVSAGDTDPAAFVKRLGQLISGARDAKPEARTTFHAVMVGNTHEAVVLKGIASVGGGSVRAITGEQSPQVVALELLNEVAQPGLRDLNIEFRGLKVAAVYPGRVPNLPAGTQQILVGRYLPEGKDQQGDIIVTGTRGSEKVRFAAKINLKDAEAGNSFIPRLWARSHLDQLLSQGTSSAVKDDIIRLSEEFHIITPYTSLLVLESDADRERFGVQRRYEMRDGERFFADGRANANFELLQQQMKRAGDWRLGLRREVLRSLLSLGRDPQAFQPRNRGYDRLQGRMAGRMRGWAVNSPASGPMNSTWFGSGSTSLGVYFNDGYAGEPVDELSKLSALGDNLWEVDSDGDGLEGDYKESLHAFGDFGEVDKKRESNRDALGGRYERQLSDLSVSLRDTEFGLEAYRFRGLELEKSVAEMPALMEYDDAFSVAEKRKAQMMPGGMPFGGGGFGMAYGFGGGEFLGRYAYQQDYTSWVNTYFPALNPAPKATAPIKDPATWPAEAIALADSLLRIDSLQKLQGGIELQRVTEYFDPRWKRTTGRRRDLNLYSDTGWVIHGLNPREQTIVSYCTPEERGIYSLAFGLGRARASNELELKTLPFSLTDFSTSRLVAGYPNFTAKTEAAGDNRVKLILTLEAGSRAEHFLIDTQRHVVLQHDSFHAGELKGTTKYEDFVELAGTWWATKTTSLNEKSQPISETKLTIKMLTTDQYATRMQAELAARPTVQFVRMPFVTLKVARQKVADGAAGFDDQLALILHNAQIQQWEDMWKHVDAAEKLAADRPGVRWLRSQLLATTRRNEEARKRLLEEVKQLAAKPQQDDLFLTDHVLNTVYSLTSWPEFTEFVQASKPVFERPVEPANPDILHSWTERQAQSLNGVGRYEVALAVRRTLAAAAPWHLHWQLEYARRLGNAGQFDAAHAWLRQELARPERSPEEQDSVRAAVCEIYRQQANWADLLKWTTEWIAMNPESPSHDSAYLQHIGALIFNDQLDKAYALADQWLADVRIEGKPTAAQWARFEAAINFANGSVPHLSFYRMDPRWFEPLAKTARFFTRSKDYFYHVQRCVTNHYFIQSDISDQLRGEWLNLLRTDLKSLNPAQINTLVGWTLSGRIELTEPINGRKQLDTSEIPNDVWQKIAAEILPRWQQEAKPHDKHLLSETLRTIYATRFNDTLLLPFLRDRIKTAPAEYKVAYQQSLFDVLLGTKWTDEIEVEAFSLINQLVDSQDASVRLASEVPALYRVVDAMLANRIARGDQELNDQGAQDKLTRPQLAEQKQEIRKAARAALSARLADLAKKADGPLSAWYTIEQMWLDVQQDQNLPQVIAECWKLLGDAPPQPIEPDDNDTVEQAQAKLRYAAFESLLRQRAFATVFYLATRKTAEPATIDRLLKYVDAGIAQRKQPNDPEGRSDLSTAWKFTKFRLLVALDRPDDLDKELRAWIREDVSTGPWRQMLAKLVAERGKLDEAIQLFEACVKDKLLTAADYRMLADWYLVSNRREAYERHRIEAYKQMPEGNLNQMIYGIRNRWRSNANLPSELDENTLFVFKALFETSAQPEQYLWQLRDLYGACRDFRLLQVIPDAVLGRSPQQIYAFLKGMQDQLLVELRNEATADEILARVKVLREKQQTPIDLRALDLLEAVVERKSSEVLNQPGPHIDACVAALTRAFQRAWSDGEPRMMSNFLYQLGGFSNEKMKTEQLRELRELIKLTTPGSRDHLLITTDLCQLLFWNYTLHDESIREMEIEVRAYTQANDGLWPHADNDVLGKYVSMYEGANRHAVGEAVLQKHIDKPVNDEQRKWLHDRLMSLYNHALEHDGSVTIGTGRAKLFDSIVTLTLKELEKAPDENVRYNLISRLNTTYDIAHRHKLPAVVEAVRKYAFEIIPAVLKKQVAQYRNTAATPTYVIGHVLEPRLTLLYVVERIEQYPQRLDIQWDNAWNAFGAELASRRHLAGKTDLDDRVLKLAIERLKRDLRAGEGNNQHIYHQSYQHFWAEKSADFAKAAEEVLGERRTSGRRAVVVALYLHSGLPMGPRAIEILLIANRDGILEESSQAVLARWLHEANRFAEMIPILEPLVAAKPDYMYYRTELMVAYFHSKRPEQLADLIKKTDAHFHAAGRWTEENMSQFARGCQGTEQWDLAQRFFTEAISLHARNNPASGRNDSTLSDYNQNLALIESKLGHTVEAVSAASAAIVCWDARHEHRKHALDALRRVLNESKDLNGYVTHLDAETKKSGQDSPILRKAVGQVYQQRNEFPKAIVQLKLALELQPHDAETHQSLIACYDATQNAMAATRQLRQLIDLKPQDIDLYKQLAERMKTNEAEAERAATSIVEASPNEAETHHAMAELRQQQNRWGEAIPHWRQVSELRRLEPTGLLKLAEAQIHEKQFDAARETLKTLHKTAWPDRFGDVLQQTRNLENQLPK